MQSLFHPHADLIAQRAVVNCQKTRKFWIGGDDLLIPYFCLRSGIGENEGCLVLIDDIHDLIQQPDPQVSGPREFFQVIGKNCLYFELLLNIRFHHDTLVPRSQ